MGWRLITYYMAYIFVNMCHVNLWLFFSFSFLKNCICYVFIFFFVFSKLVVTHNLLRNLIIQFGRRWSYFGSPNIFNQQPVFVSVLWFVMKWWDWRLDRKKSFNVNRIIKGVDSFCTCTHGRQRMNPCHRDVSAAVHVQVPLRMNCDNLWESLDFHSCAIIRSEFWIWSKLDIMFGCSICWVQNGKC